MATKTYKIPEQNLDRIEAAVRKINRRCRRNGFGEVQVTVERDLLQLMDSFVEAQPVIVYDVTIEGEIPVLDGQDMVARLDILVGPDGAENVVIEHSETLDEDIERRYRDPSVAKQCDHCGHNRLRKRVYLLRDYAGNETRVGSTCMQDYHATGDEFARLCNEVIALDQLATSAAKGELVDPRKMGQSVDLQELIAEVLPVWQRDPWRGTDRYAKDTLARIRRGRYGQVTDAYRNKAADVITWARDHLASQEDLTDEQHNTVVATRYDRIPERLAPEAARAIAYYDEATHRVRPVQQPQPVSQPPSNTAFGEAGQSFRTGVRVETIEQKRSRFNGSVYWLVTMKVLKSDQILVWFAKTRELFPAPVDGNESNIGRLKLIEGIVKAHKTWKGTVSTQVTKVREA